MIINDIKSDQLAAQGEIRLFLRMFTLLAAHFQIKSELLNNFTEEYLVALYERALKEEAYSDVDFIANLASVLKSPSIKTDALLK